MIRSDRPAARRFTPGLQAALALLLLLGGCAGGGGGACGSYAELAEDVPADATSPETVSYRLNPGDTMQISVWREEELAREVLVQPDGSISFPLVGQIRAEGRTAGELEAEISERLERFIPDAVATVELLTVRGNQIFVMGEVPRPGAYEMSGPLTLVQAISLAGGFTSFAAPDRIRILREREDQEMAFTVDYGCVASGTNVEANVPLKAGDTIIVQSKTLGLF